MLHKKNWQSYFEHFALVQAKTREPHMVKEDAYNLYEARISYLHESLELVLALNAPTEFVMRFLYRFAWKVWTIELDC